MLINSRSFSLKSGALLLVSVSDCKFWLSNPTRAGGSLNGESHHTVTGGGGGGGGVRATGCAKPEIGILIELTNEIAILVESSDSVSADNIRAH
jgi:hypothetical protein